MLNVVMKKIIEVFEVTKVPSRDWFECPQKFNKTIYLFNVDPSDLLINFVFMSGLIGYLGKIVLREHQS